MAGNKPEIIRDAVRPLIIYLILFISIREILYFAAGAAAARFSCDPVMETPAWYAALRTAVTGFSSACAAIPLLGDGRRQILTMRVRSLRAWITKRRDRRFLMGILPVGTICLCALLNLLLAGEGDPAAYPVPPAALPLEAAVYGILTPFIEELVYRGIVWYRLRKGFSVIRASLISSLLFGIAHGSLPQGTYAFLMGIVFSLSYELTRRFEVPFLLHSACNLAVLAAASAGWTGILRTPMWTTFFAVTAAAVFSYWGMRYLRSSRL